MAHYSHYYACKFGVNRLKLTEIFEKNRYNGQPGDCNVSVGRTITRTVWAISPRFLHQTKLVVFGLGQLITVSFKLAPTEPCCHGNENFRTLPQNLASVVKRRTTIKLGIATHSSLFFIHPFTPHTVFCKALFPVLYFCYVRYSVPLSSLILSLSFMLMTQLLIYFHPLIR